MNDKIIEALKLQSENCIKCAQYYNAENKKEEAAYCFGQDSALRTAIMYLEGIANPDTAIKIFKE